ncbi:MAG: PD-(D/E)XK nuclease family protein [Promethearchaeota archaeon]
MNSIFNKRQYPRVSQFKISGLKSAFMRSFSKKLIQNKKIKKLDSESKLPKLAQIVHENYFKENLNKIPKHDPILKYILINDKDSIAKEVPIWKKMKNVYLTGHIDLIQIENDTVKVIDYKPEGNFLISLPQVAMYGLLIKSQLKINKIKCVSFNKEGAWEYDPNILKKDIKDYLISLRIDERPWENFY